MTSLVSRRALLAGTGLTAAGAMLAGPGRGLLDALPFVGGHDLPLVRSTLAPRVGESFRVELPTGVTNLRLESVADLPAPSTISDSEGQFVARFVGDAETRLAQDTYRLSNTSFGRFDLFLVPMSDPVDAVPVYEAVFNRVEITAAPVGVTS